MSNETDDRLPRYKIVEPGPVAAFFVGLFICGPLTYVFYALFILLGK